ncbi:MAG: hypothetical protein J6D54_08860 [Olsenella sp.]|nr:hypothetical protein [Olsenella sp.]
MRIGVAQINTRPGDLGGIADRIVSLSERALDQGVELLVFPLTCLAGPMPLSEADQDEFLVDAMETFASLARHVACPCVVPVVSDLDGDTLPEAVLIRNGRVLPLRLSAYADSAHGGDVDGAGGMPPFAPPRFEAGGMSFVVAFTYDDLEDCGELEHGADAVIFISGYGYANDDPSSALGAALSENRYVGDARALGAWLVGVGSLGGYGTQVFTGSSFVLSPTGDLVDSAPSFGEDLMVSDLSNVSPHQERVVPEVYDRPLFLWQSLSLGLRDYVHKLGMHHVLLALDGSLSSMVCAVLASDALGPMNVHVVVDAPEGIEREAACQRLARNLRLDVREAGDLPLLPRTSDGADLLLRRGVVEAYLASWAAELGGVVLSTLDKTGLALGEFLPSPTSAVLQPLGDVYRSLVMDLARMRNTISPVLPTVAPSPREVPSLSGVLRDGCSDETWIRSIDSVLQDHIEWGRTAREIASYGVQRQRLVESVLAALDAAELRRVGGGQPLVVSTVTLADVARPLGFSWHASASERASAVSDLLDSTLEQLGSLANSFTTDSEVPAPREEDVAESLEGSSALRDALSYLRDFSMGGMFDPEGMGAPASGRDSPGGWSRAAARFRDSSGNSWPAPFSEN